MTWDEDTTWDRDWMRVQFIQYLAVKDGVRALHPWYWRHRMEMRRVLVHHFHHEGTITNHFTYKQLHDFDTGDFAAMTMASIDQRRDQGTTEVERAILLDPWWAFIEDRHDTRRLMT